MPFYENGLAHDRVLAVVWASSMSYSYAKGADTSTSIGNCGHTKLDCFEKEVVRRHHRNFQLELS